jgi:hypothetical protein
LLPLHWLFWLVRWFLPMPLSIIVVITAIIALARLQQLARRPGSCRVFFVGAEGFACDQYFSV